MDNAKFKSDFALLDVKAGRGALAKRIAAGEKVRVRVDLIIDGDIGNDDGVSREFCCTVQSIKEFRK